MLTVTIQVRAANWNGVRLAMRQAYQRDLVHPLRPGPNGRLEYELRVLTEVQSAEPFTFTED